MNTITSTNFTLVSEMVAEQDTIVITDPCYILRRDDWERVSDLGDCKDMETYLHEKLEFGEVMVSKTYIGDWCNVIKNDKGQVISEFAADAGLVMVCTVSDLDHYGYDIDKVWDLKQKGCIATVPNFTGTVRIVKENVKNSYDVLAVVQGYDKNGSEVFHSLHVGEEV